MEIILKKSKITASILMQTRQASLVDFEKSEYLGWCNLKGNEYIVLYEPGKQVLTTYRLFKDATTDGNKLTVTLGGNYTPKYYTFEDEKECRDAQRLIRVAKNMALEKGQFFI